MLSRELFTKILRLDSVFSQGLLELYREPQARISFGKLSDHAILPTGGIQA